MLNSSYKLILAPSKRSFGLFEICTTRNYHSAICLSHLTAPFPSRIYMRFNADLRETEYLLQTASNLLARLKIQDRFVSRGQRIRIA